jgi:hypothetical protein
MKNNEEAEKISEKIKIRSKKQLLSLLDFKRQNSSFIELELKICKSLNELGAIILEQIIPLIYGDGYNGPAVEIDEETAYNCVARARGRGLVTAFGKINISRAVYTEFHSGGTKSFVDEALDIEDKRKSPLVRYWSDLLGTVAPFEEAKSTLEKIRGIHISTKQIELSTESLGAKITKAHNEDIKDIELNDKGEVPPAIINLNLNAERTVYIETDGCHINTDEEWKECKTFMLFEVEKISEDDHRIKNKFYYSTMKDVNEIKRQLKYHLERYCGKDEVRIVCIGDGAKWIWNMMAELFPAEIYHSGIIEIVDWYHAKEKIVEIKNEIFGDTEKGRNFLEECESYLAKGNIEIIEQLLEQLRDKQELTGKREFVDDKLHYFMNNKDKMRYEMFKEKGLCIGSGAIESANKYVVQRRLKQAGMKWNEDNANYMVHLRAEYVNGEFEKHYGLKDNALIEDIAT